MELLRLDRIVFAEEIVGLFYYRQYFIIDLRIGIR